MDAPRAPLFARLLVGASLALTVITAGFGVHSVGYWHAHMQGRSVREQRASVSGVAWFRTEFTGLLDRLEEVLPPEARLLVEPAADPGVLTPGARIGSPPRWFLPLTHYAWPVRVYVRRPEQAVIFFTYERWLDHHFEVLDIDGEGPRTPAAVRLAEEDERELRRVERQLAWRARFVEGPLMIVPASQPQYSFDPSRKAPLDGAGTVYEGNFSVTDAWGSFEAGAGVLWSDAGAFHLPGPVNLSKNGRRARGDGWSLDLAKGWRAHHDPSTGSYSVGRRASPER